MCMYVCMYICMYVYERMSWCKTESIVMCIGVYMSSVYLCVYMHTPSLSQLLPRNNMQHAIDKKIDKRICVCVFMSVYAHACMYICMHVYMYACTYVCMSTYLIPVPPFLPRNEIVSNIKSNKQHTIDKKSDP